MEKKNSLVYEEYNDITERDAADAALLQQARDITKQAYAPYFNSVLVKAKGSKSAAVRMI